MSLEQRNAALSLVKNEQCDAAFTKERIDPLSMICAGHEVNDACQGDSGGPLICIENGRPALRGIVSFGDSCGKAVSF